MKLYDIFGVDRANGIICGNTILCYYYTPLFSHDGNNGEYIRAMSVIGGKYIKLLDATKEYPVDTLIKYDVCDYGGFVKSPVGNALSDKFVLFSVLCQINFIICCVDSWVREEISTTSRACPVLPHFAYSVTNLTISQAKCNSANCGKSGTNISILGGFLFMIKILFVCHGRIYRAREKC